MKKKQNMKREYGRNRYYNMSEEKEQRLKEYQKSIAKLIKVKAFDFQ